MSFYSYDSDDDDDDLVLVRQGSELTARAANDSRYSMWTQTEMEKQMFSWSFEQVRNRNLLKKKVILLSYVACSTCLSSFVFQMIA